MSSSTSLILSSLASLLLIGQFAHQQDTYSYANSAKYASSSLLVIEDQSFGLYAATSDNNYVLISPNLTEFGWSSLSVNDNQIFVLKSNNFTFEKQLNELDENARDFLTEIRGNFQYNLAGLELTPTSGQLIRGSSNSRAYLANEIGHLQDGGLVYFSQVSSNQQPNDSPASWQSNCGLQSLNYYQLSGSRLNQSLGGDIYQIDLSTNRVLDVYSSSVSVREFQDRSILYRDHRYFSYGRPNMPLSIKRIFLIGNHVIFIYNDDSILVKSSWFLDGVELELIVKCRAELKAICNRWQADPFGLGV